MYPPPPHHHHPQEREGEADRQRQRDRDSQRDRERERGREGERDRDRDRQRQRETEGDRDRDKQTDRDRETKKQRQTDRQTDWHTDRLTDWQTDRDYTKTLLNSRTWCRSSWPRTCTAGGWTWKGTAPTWMSRAQQQRPRKPWRWRSDTTAPRSAQEGRKAVKTTLLAFMTQSEMRRAKPSFMHNTITYLFLFQSSVENNVVSCKGSDWGQNAVSDNVLHLWQRWCQSITEWNG